MGALNPSRVRTRTSNFLTGTFAILCSLFAQLLDCRFLQHFGDFINTSSTYQLLYSCLQLHMGTRAKPKTELELYIEEKERQRKHNEECARARARALNQPFEIVDPYQKDKEKFLKQMYTTRYMKPFLGLIFFAGKQNAALKKFVWPLPQKLSERGRSSHK